MQPEISTPELSRALLVVFAPLLFLFLCVGFFRFRAWVIRKNGTN